MLKALRPIISFYSHKNFKSELESILQMRDLRIEQLLKGTHPIRGKSEMQTHVNKAHVKTHSIMNF